MSKALQEFRLLRSLHLTQNNCKTLTRNTEIWRRTNLINIAKVDKPTEIGRGQDILVYNICNNTDGEEGFLERRPREGYRSVGKQPMRRTDDFHKDVGKNLIRKARNGVYWTYTHY